MNRGDDFWLDVLQWFLGIVALVLVGSIVLCSVEFVNCVEAMRIKARDALEGK